MAQPLSQDFRALLKVVTGRGGVFLVLGRTDVGKSMLVQSLVRLVTARGEAVAVLDADLGQSTYGLPTTLNLVRFSPAIEPPVPERLAHDPASVRPCFCAHTSRPRPQRRTNPAESSWRKASSRS